MQATAPLGANATFRCTAVGRIFWEIDNVQILTEDLVAGQRGVDRFVPLSTVNHSEAVLTATLVNNGTVVQCHVKEFEVVGPPLLLNSSEEVSLLVFGKFLSLGQPLEVRYWWRVSYVHSATPFLCTVCYALYTNRLYNLFKLKENWRGILLMGQGTRYLRLMAELN